MIHLHGTPGGGQQWKDQHRNSSLATIGKESLFLQPLCIDFAPPSPHEAGFVKEQMILLPVPRQSSCLCAASCVPC
jgi:hypothetical protein